MKIYTPLKWVLLSLAILIICSHSHASQTPFRTDHDFHLPNQTHDHLGTQPTKSKHTHVKLTPPVLISGVLCFLAAAISNAGGIGGGGLFITILTLVARLDLKTASSFSAFMVTGGSIASVMYHMISSSPNYGTKSLIDHEICFLSEPVMLLGVSIGVMCNVMFPEWLITVLCSAFLAWSTFKTIMCGVGKWKSETGERKQKGWGETENGLVGIDGNCGGSGVEINKESGLSGSVVGLESRLVVGQDGNFGGNGLEINKESGLSGKLVESCKQGIQWRKLGGLMVIWFSFFVLRLLTGNRYGQGIALVKPCEVGYWILSSMQIPLALSFTTWILYKRGSLLHQTSNHQEKEDQTRGGPSREFIFPVIALLAGVLGGVFGIGGGMLLSPFFLQLGIAPEVAAATCSLLVLFSSSMSAIQYFLLGMDHQHVYGALTLAFVCFSASLIGLMVVKKAIKTYGRASLIVFSVAIVIALSTVLITTFGALNAWREYKSGGYMGFNRPCQQVRS
ncbi:sulfite exporter TauE/SafE family protein 5-like [Rhododendron vialii]|uniref:sulfite exporter TauE/SafE family protein 5-like n=1 Tax=Rhododendron vialii TaxID=182163 RepID=UPI00265EE169|nr:sulfite exporter TauE/SafE family protein 5-like [Rhododendron vialii]